MANIDEITVLIQKLNATTEFSKANEVKNDIDNLLLGYTDFTSNHKQQWNQWYANFYSDLKQGIKTQPLSGGIIDLIPLLESFGKEGL